LHEVGKLFALEQAEIDPTVHVDPGDHEAGVHAVMDIARIDIALELGW